MQSRLSPLIRLLSVSAIAAACAFTPVLARTPVLEATFEPDVGLEAEDLFSDAAFGVDPMVTGPVSEEFRARQLKLGCAEAKWPNISVGCYPE